MDLGISDQSDFDVREFLADKKNVNNINSAHQSKTLLLNIKLTNWAANQIHPVNESMKELLLVLNKHVHKHLHKDATALLKTSGRIYTQEIF